MIQSTYKVTTFYILTFTNSSAVEVTCFFQRAQYLLRTTFDVTHSFEVVWTFSKDRGAVHVTKIECGKFLHWFSASECVQDVSCMILSLVAFEVGCLMLTPAP